jgi:hypothetical protein
MSKKIYCYECGEQVGELASGSKIKKGVVHFCAYCNELEEPIEVSNDGGIDFLKDLFKIP